MSKVTSNITVLSIQIRLHIPCEWSASRQFTGNIKPYFPQNHEMFHKNCDLLVMIGNLMI